MQARKTLFSFVLVVAALAGLTSAAPPSTADATTAAAPPTQEQAGSTAAGASVASADKQAGVGPEAASTASQANPQNAAVFAATGPADAPTPATTGEDASGKLADHQKRNADAAPAGKIPDSTDKADSATQANPQSAAVFSATTSPTDASTVPTAADEASSKTGHEKRNADAAASATGKIAESADKADSAAQGAAQLNAAPAGAINSQTPDATEAGAVQTKRSESAGTTADAKEEGTAENSHPHDSQTPQDALQLNDNPTGLAAESAPDNTDNQAPPKKDSWCVLF